MKKRTEEYIFKASGDRELNDQVYPGSPKQLLYHSYTFRLSPKSKFWRFGVRLSKSNTIEFSPKGRYINPDYPDLQVVVGDRPLGEWINPNKIELGQYYYLQGYQDQNPFDVCSTYREGTDVVFTVKHNVELNGIEVSYEAEGCPRFQKQLQNFGYQYFQYFAWADWIDFELHCKVEIEDHRYIDIPIIPVTANDIEWLQLMYNRFMKEQKIQTEYQESDLWENFPRDFNPKGINPLLLIGGTEITLYGIYHIDPISPLFETFDKVVYAIRNRLRSGKIPDTISSKDISDDLTNYSQKNVFLVFILLASFTEFARGFGRDNSSIIQLHINDPTVLEQYRKFAGLEKFYIEYLKQKGIVKPEAVKLNITFSAPQNKESGIGRTTLKRKRQDQFSPVMGVEQIIGITAEVIESFRAGKGQMIGIFGKWGRGKTFLIDELHKFLMKRKEERGNSVINYLRVDYHAWKYQETPASWAYLYELFADKYLESKFPARVVTNKWTIKNTPRIFAYYFKRICLYLYIRTKLSYCVKLICLNINRHKFWPLVSFLLAFIIAVLPPILFKQYFYDQYVYWLAITPAYLIIALSVLSKLRKPLSTRAIDLAKKYGTRYSFKETLGLQAAIQDELVVLVKTWISEKKVQINKILLVVEDIDRCTEKKIMENIDALRVMLDNDDIAKRLIVLTAIDERILKNAIHIKYDELIPSDGKLHEKKKDEKNKVDIIRELTSEYLDKLFIAAIKLGDLNPSQKQEFIDELLEEYVVEFDSSTQNTSEPPKETSPASDQNSTLGRQSTSTSASAVQQPLAAATAAADAFQGLHPKEKELLLANIATWNTATPRNIIIFYYRFLLCKNFLHTSYLRKISKTIWQEVEVIKGLIEAIHEFSRNYEPSKITEKKINTLNKVPTEKIKMAEGCTAIDRQDYINMLEALEIFIAY